MFFVIMTAMSLMACTDAKNSDPFLSSVQFSDSHVYQRLIETFDRSGIKYRKGKDHVVYYSAKDSEKVRVITSEINAEYYPGCGVFFSDKAAFSAMERELKNREIPFSIAELDQGPTITCAPQYRDALEQILRSRETLKKKRLRNDSTLNDRLQMSATTAKGRGLVKTQKIQCR